MPRRPGPPSPVQYTPVTRPILHHAQDQPREHLAEKVRSGQWVRVRRGVYVEIEPGLAGYDRERQLALAQTFALAEKTSVPAVAGYVSAALVHGMPVGRLAAIPHLIQQWHPSGGRSDGVRRHVLQLPDDHCTEIHGIAVTTLERTVVDCAMSLSPRDGLIVADSALHIGADPDLCLGILESMGPRRGVRRAREVLALADGGAESPGETLARFHALRIGLPSPTTQMLLATDAGDTWPDFGWPEWHLVVEYDGVAKYTANGSASAAVLAERNRERAIERRGYVVIRVLWADIRDPSRFRRTLLHHVPAEVVRALRPRPQLALR